MKTKVSRDTIFDLQYADDAAIPSHTAVGLQHSLDLLAASYQRAGLIVNTKKTEVLAQSVNTSTAALPTFTVHSDSLSYVHQFTYLGSIFTSDCDLITAFLVASATWKTVVWADQIGLRHHVTNRGK